MTLEELVEGLADGLTRKGEFANTYTWEPINLGNEFPLLTVRYLNDISVGGSNEEFLPDRITFQCRIYYPVQDVGDGEEDGLKVAQKICLAADSQWREELGADPFIEGQAMNCKVLNTRSYGMADPAAGNLYVHELNVEVYVH